MGVAPDFGDNRRISAGFTYLGQFIDHDITFDPTSQLQKVNDPDALVNFRTPRLDLDSLYGAGPADQPYLYEWWTGDDRGIKLLVGDDDLPRNDQDRALIGDPRNDENLILAQLHLLFIRFHNRVVDHVRDDRGLTGAELLAEAQRIVRWHFQWIVGHDFLRRVLGDGGRRDHGPTGGRATRSSPSSSRPRRTGSATAWFAAATGSMTIRSENPVTIFAPEDDPESDQHLGGFRRMPAALLIDWDVLLRLG